ncbi:MAG: hypothetical protein QS721_05030 [Candidatus Endonucleobacter sp. (ex Gigantidas childressi)]|nr:hypothetical protein [Candidatus Endonucleobacter sp. (ex Gigantidas childressi)]
MVVEADNKRNIADRPAEVETRETLGHWGIDTVMGKVSIPVAFQVATLLASLTCRLVAI